MSRTALSVTAAALAFAGGSIMAYASMQVTVKGDLVLHGSALTFVRSLLEVDTTIKKPTNFYELLQSIKYALDHDLLHREDFYTDEHIRRLSGADRIVWNERGALHQSVWGSEFGNLAPPVHAGNMTLEGMDFHLERKVAIPKVTAVSILLLLRNDSDPKTTFETVESVFGRNWQPDSYIPSPHAVYKPTIGKHGNERIRYEARHGPTMQKVVIQFNEKGNVYMARFEQESK
jgi:hypothetical protein